jgi:hypothetical protein
VISRRDPDPDPGPGTSHKLRLQSSFHDLLRTQPGLGSCTVRTLRLASEPPWESESQKLKVPRYEPEDAPQDEYEY